jgi:pantoate--beta-alanine ligase
MKDGERLDSMQQIIERTGQTRLVTTCDEVFQFIAAARASGKRVGLVPTMGALHEGHLSLVEASRAECDVTVVSIFVNPTQFGPSEDLDKYPRSLDTDLAALDEYKVDLVFAPSNDEMYPADFSTLVEPPDVAKPLEGDCRPGHFRGVATVVLKLFNVAPADVAYFGQKDYQQSLVIRRMVTDLNVPIEIRVCPIVREVDGLALSSRNVYLSPEQRQRSLAISRSLKFACDLFRRGATEARLIVDQITQELNKAGIHQIDYVSLSDAETLAPVDCVDASTMALIAARVGQTRLIDNCRLGDNMSI